MADASKTEQPTPRRLQQARREGQFPVSREMVAAAQFLAFVSLLAAYGGEWYESARWGLRGYLALVSEAAGKAISPQYTVLEFGAAVAKPLGLLLGSLLLVTLAGQLVITRFGLATNKLAPDLTRLNPFARLGQMFSQNIYQFGQAVVLLPLFLYAVWAIVEDNLGAYVRLPLVGLEGAVALIAASLEDLLWKAGALFLVAGVIDLVRQKRKFMAGMRMSKQEIRDEMKEVEGNPQIKMKIRRLQREAGRRRMMKDVETATAVVVNPTHYAVAIRYWPSAMPAPKVVAKGKDYLALRIRETAIRNQVPVIENPPLARALYKSAEVGQEIPSELYRAVAEVLAYIYRLMNGRLPGAPR